jgi:4-hydroxybenzoate polyprenyltransferase
VTELIKSPPFPIVWLKAMRPKQWTKNGVLLAPLLFARSIFEEGKLLKAILGVVAFSLLASAVYVVNDWVDKDKDRLHPEKKKRPIAAGHLGPLGAGALVLLCLGLCTAVSLQLPIGFSHVLIAYLVMQVFYTGFLKKLVIVDVMIIALGFIVRVMAGAEAINVQVSNWLFLCTLLLAVFLGFAKRRAELSSLEDATAHRSNLADYSLPMIDQMMSISAACTILAYGLYTVSKETIDHVGSDRLKFTMPCVIYGVFRYLFLVHKRGAGGAPEKVLLGDAPLLVNIVLFLLLAGWALYVPQ